MKKIFYVICLVSILLFSLTACKSKLERVEPKDDTKIEIKEDKQEDGVLPEDVFDEDDYSDSKQNDDAIIEEENQNGLEEITENYIDNGPLILPEDVFE